MTQKIIIAVIGLVLLLAIGAYFFRDSLSFLPSLGETPISQTKYVCDLDKTIDASIYEGKAVLVLSDGRTIDVPQLISASGVRYGNGDESFVFWTEGAEAYISEGLQGDLTYTNCEVPVVGEEPRSTYASSTMGISFKYPKTYTLGVGYQYTGFPKKPISGIKVIIPATMATGTNLSNQDTGVSIEQLPRALNCSADIYMVANVRAETISEGGVTYSVASSTEGAAGQRYEEIVYALPSTKPCTAVRYFIHYAAIENFEPGMVREFDRAALLLEFDKIRDSLRISATSTASMTP